MTTTGWPLVAHLAGATLLVMLTDTSGCSPPTPGLTAARLIDAVRHSDEVLDQVGAGGSGPLGSGGGDQGGGGAYRRLVGDPDCRGTGGRRRHHPSGAGGGAGGKYGGPPPPPPPHASSGSPSAAARKDRSASTPGRSGRWSSRGARSSRSALSRSPVISTGAAVDVLDPDGAVVAKGLARLAAADLSLLAGNRGTEAIHRDDLVILTG